MAVITFLGVPMWLLALVGGSLAFAVADILCDIVISEGDTHEVGSAEDSDTEEGVELAAISTPRRDASKALKPGYAPVANQSTPALPSRSEHSPVKPSYLVDGQSADASLSGTQDAAISGLVTATWLLGSVLYKLFLAPGALAHASGVEMRWRPDTHIEFWFAMLGGLCAFLHNFYLLKAFEGAPSTVLLPLIQVASIWVLLGSSVLALFRGQRFMSPLHGLAYALMFVGGCLPATGGDVSRLLRRSFWKQRYVFYAIGSELTLGLHDLLLSDCSRDQHSEARAPSP